MHLNARSEAIITPLLKDTERPSWVCWRAHVRHLRFCLRHVFTLSTDASELDRLNDEFLQAFAAVPQWQDAGYEKPKFHPAKHFSTVSAFAKRTCLLLLLLFPHTVLCASRLAGVSRTRPVPRILVHAVGGIPPAAQALVRRLQLVVPALQCLLRVGDKVGAALSRPEARRLGRQLRRGVERFHHVQCVA